MWILYVHRNVGCSILCQSCSCSHLLALFVEEDEVQLACSLYLGRDIEHTILVVVYKVRSNTDILQMQLGITGKEIAFTSHTTQAPEVLILIPGAIAPAEGLEGNQILALLQIRSDVKLGSYLAILCITGKLTVYIEIDVGSNATEMSDNLLAIPVGRDVDNTAVRTYMVVLGRNCWWLLVKMSTPAEAYVHIFRITESVHLPDTWQIHGLPFGIIKIFLVEVGRTLVGISHPVELPGSVKRKEILALRLVHVQDILAHDLTVFLRNPVICRIGEEIGVQRKTIDGIHLKVVPFCVSWLLDSLLIQRLNGSLRFGCTKGCHC